MDRATGVKRSQETAGHHMSAIKTFLPSVTKESVRALADLGKKGGKIDQLLEEKK